jgi:hypothetical protein
MALKTAEQIKAEYAAEAKVVGPGNTTKGIEVQLDIRDLLSEILDTLKKILAK